MNTEPTWPARGGLARACIDAGVRTTGTWLCLLDRLCGRLLRRIQISDFIDVVGREQPVTIRSLQSDEPYDIPDPSVAVVSHGVPGRRACLLFLDVGCHPLVFAFA